MIFIDEEHLLTEEEVNAFYNHLKNYNFQPDQFRLEVTEDQDNLDMDDLNYVIIIYAKVTHIATNKTKTYRSRSKTGIWLAEFKTDLKNNYFL